MADDDTTTDKHLLTKHWHYLFLSRRAILQGTKKLGAYDAAQKALTPETPPLARMKMLTDLTESLDAIVTAQVFAGLTSEAYINAYLHQHFSGLNRDSLDKLSTPAKWAIVTELKHPGKGFKNGESILENLNKVRKARDKLVHSKPVMGERSDSDQIGKDIAEAAKLIVYVEDAILALYAIDADFEREFVERLAESRHKMKRGDPAERLPGH